MILISACLSNLSIVSIHYTILISACYQIYQENINTRSTESLNPSSERRILEETEDEDNDDDEESSESESHTYNDFPSQKSQNSFQVPNKETRKNIRKAETSNSMTITSNTNTAKKSDVSSRLEYSLNLIEATFSDIFVAIEVNSNYQPRDIIEEERSRKRVKDFTCRVGRMLYQAKQNYITLKNPSAGRIYQVFVRL